MASPGSDDLQLRMRRAARAVLSDPSQFPEEFISWLMRKITFQLQPQSSFTTIGGSGGIKEITSTHSTIGITDAFGPVTNLEMELSTSSWSPTLLNNVTTLTPAGAFGAYAVFGNPSQYCIGIVEIQIGADSGAGDGDHYIIGNWPANLLYAGYQFGFGVSQVISTGKEYAAYLQKLGTTTATIQCPGTTPGGGESIAWAARPTYPDTYADDDWLFRGSFLYPVSGGE